jgi:hypothetical protein
MIIRIKTPHNPGHFEPIIIGQVVPFKEACDELRDRIEVHLKDLKVPLP